MEERSSKKEEELIQMCKILDEIYKVKILDIKMFMKEKCDKEKSDIEINFDYEKEQLLDRQSEIVKKYEMKIIGMF